MLRNGILLPLYEWPLMNSGFFQGFLDLAFIILAYYGASRFTARPSAPVDLDAQFVQGIMLVSGIQLLVFYLGGLYKGTIRQFGMGDVIKILKLATFAALATWMVLTFLPKAWHPASFLTYVLDFYFLLSFVMGTRVSFHILTYLSRREQCDGKRKVLLYGADSNSVLMIQRLINDPRLGYCPVGFLDDDPSLEGKRLNGYPIFGGHWKAERLLKKLHIEEIIISCEAVKPKVLERLTQLSKTYGISLRRSELRLEKLGELVAPAGPSNGSAPVHATAPASQAAVPMFKPD